MQYKSFYIPVGLILLSILFYSCESRQKYDFEYAGPVSLAWSEAKLRDLEKHLEKSGASSMLILVGDKIIFEWGSTDRVHTIHSIRKCLLNSLIGIALEEGKIDTSATLNELGIQDIDPRITAEEGEARVADMLRSRSGVYHHAAGVSQGMLRDMPERGTHAPGEHYYYNNWDFNTLGYILEEATGESIYTLFLDQIARPLGMHDYKGRYASIDGENEGVELPDKDGFYQYEHSKSRYPAYHFRMSARDLALYGLLYLHYGEWEGQQILPREWIDASTRPYSVYNPEYGLAYGMLWRVLVPENAGARPSFLHTGAGIHMLGVYPGLDMVVVHRVDTEDRDDYDQSDFYKMIRLLFEARN